MKMVKLGDVAQIERNAADPAALDLATPYLGLEHIERGGTIISSSTVGAAELKSTKFRFDQSHVLYGKLRPNLAKVSRPSITGVCSTDILPIRPGPDLDRSFLAHYLLLPEMTEYATTRTSGANLPRLSPTMLAAFPVPLPPLDEQRRIAAILDKADEIRTKRREALAHLTALPQSLFHAMFGDPDATSETTRFAQVAQLAGGRNLVADDPSAASPFRVLKISAVTSGIYKPVESKPLPAGYVPPDDHLVRAGDLLMSRANTTELVGAVAYVHDTPAGLVLPDKIWRFRWADPLSMPTFYHALFRTPAIRRRISRLSSGTGGSMKNISKGKLGAMPIPVVPVELQRKFAAKVAAIETQRTAVEHALATDDELFASLQSRAFRGEL